MWLEKLQWSDQLAKLSLSISKNWNLSAWNVRKVPVLKRPHQSYQEWSSILGIDFHYSKNTYAHRNYDLAKFSWNKYAGISTPENLEQLCHPKLATVFVL